MTDLYLPPADEAPGAPPLKDRFRAQFQDRNSRFLLIIGGAVIIAALVVAMVGMNHFQSVSDTPGVAIQGKTTAQGQNPLNPAGVTTRMADTITEEEHIRAEKAANAGVSSMSTPLNPAKPIVPTTDLGADTQKPLANNSSGSLLPPPPSIGGLPSPPAPKVQPQPVTTALPAPQPQRSENSSARRQQQQKPNNSYMAQATGLMDSWRLTAHNVKSDRTNLASAANAQPPVAQAVAQGVSQMQTPVIAAGDILYGRLITRAISSAPGPVVAQMVGGPLNGARLMGTFSNNYDRMTLQFVGLTLPNGQSVGINAVAVDPATATTALATDVDYHYFERYGLTLAAAFMTGFGQALSDKQQTSTTSAFGSTTTESSESSTQDAVYAGVAQVGQAVSNDINRNQAFYDKPTVLVESGTLVGLLFMQPVTMQ